MALKSKHEREQIDMVKEHLSAAGILYNMRRNSNGHIMFEFYVAGQKKLLVCSNSGDPRAIKNARSILRRLLAA